MQFVDAVNILDVFVKLRPIPGFERAFVTNIFLVVASSAFSPGFPVRVLVADVSLEVDLVLGPEVRDEDSVLA